MKTLLSISPAKNGTTSMFNFLSKHPEIITTKIKEPQNSGNSWQYPDKYYSIFTAFPDNGLFLDGTPNIFFDLDKFHFDKIKDKLIFNNFKLIYILRPYHKYFVSTVCEGETFSKHFLYSDQLQRTERMIGIENIYVDNLVNIENDQEKLWKFLNIKNIKLKMSWENKTDIDQKYIYWTKQLKNHPIKFDKDGQIIKEKYGIEIG